MGERAFDGRGCGVERGAIVLGGVEFVRGIYLYWLLKSGLEYQFFKSLKLKGCWCV
jgi:hypothetical protein